MENNIVKNYRDCADLERKIIMQYLSHLKDVIKSNKRLLNDSTWAATDDEYHRQCRKELMDENSNANNQIIVLSK